MAAVFRIPSSYARAVSIRPMQRVVHCDREGVRKCLRLRKKPLFHGASLGHKLSSSTEIISRFGVPEFRQERSGRARDVQDRVTNRCQYAVNTAIKHMSPKPGQSW